MAKGLIDQTFDAAGDIALVLAGLFVLSKVVPGGLGGIIGGAAGAAAGGGGFLGSGVDTVTGRGAGADQGAIGTVNQTVNQAAFGPNAQNNPSGASGNLATMIANNPKFLNEMLSFQCTGSEGILGFLKLGNQFNWGYFRSLQLFWGYPDPGPNPPPEFLQFNRATGICDQLPL